MVLSYFSIAVISALVTSLFVCFCIFTLPSTYTHFSPGQFRGKDFKEADRKDSARSGYAYFQKHKNEDDELPTPTSVSVVVLGDIGRSPRMQNHALAIATRGGTVDLFGYVDSEIHPDIRANRFITIVPLDPWPKSLQTNIKAVFLLLAPFKVLWQTLFLYHALGYRTEPTKFMLVQNPPAVPTLAVAYFISSFRNTRLIIDWHNFGYSILGLRLGPTHPLVRLSAWYEGTFAKGATSHFAVSNAMCRRLKQTWAIEALPLHDRPPRHFQPLSPTDRSAVLHRLPETAKYAADILSGKWRLIVSSTSWTPDEDFSLLLKALAKYSTEASQSRPPLPNILAIITGKGPQKAYYSNKIHQMSKARELENVSVISAWLSTEDYAALLGAADLGISLHTSSSGVDLPMKVVDMFGTGLPVAGYNAFEAWPELVKEGENGLGFKDSAGLGVILHDLFEQPKQLQRLREGALKECSRRWDDEWMPVAGKLFSLKG